MPPTIRQLKKDKRSKKKRQEDFLLAFVDLVSVTRAAKKALVHRTTIYDWIKDDDQFAKDFDKACELATFKLEDEAVRRAYEGTIKPIYQGGKKVGTIREYSDTLLIVLLKARAPKKYIERIVTAHTGGDEYNPIRHELKIIMVNSDIPVAESEDQVS